VSSCQTSLPHWGFLKGKSPENQDFYCSPT
jgi:hypothetical protein